ncbi:MAG: cation:proton antiporter [Candidatus Methanomethylophilaceae archaeon]|jgi:CPA2 family monovalent cation:H+ antiporter-2
MEEIVLLLNMTFILLIGAVCTVIFKKLKMPTIIGYLVTGIILANYWAGESENTEFIVTLLADLGLVLLMFCIGMGFNLKKLRRKGTFAMMVVMIQVPIMILGGYFFGVLMGWGAIECIFFGAIISGSSTAVITAVLAETDKLNRDEVETIILITVIEDVAQVLILSMASPLLVGSSMSIESIAVMLITIILFIAAAMVLGLMFIPKILDWMGNKMPDEVLLVFALGLCFGMALLSVYIGMSMAIGAFLMGVIVSQSYTSKTIEKDVTPMKNIFMAMFFISIGLQITPGDMVNNIPMILLFFIVYAVLKSSSVFIVYFVGNKPLRLSFMSAVSLVAMGEFAFIISKEAFDAGVITQDFYTSVIGAALLSMIMLPIISKHADKICDKAHEYAPAFLYNSVMKAEKMRSDQYAKLALSSKVTATKFRAKLTMAYVDVIAIGLILAGFYFGTPDLAQFMYDNVLSFSYDDCYTLILLAEFLILLIPLYMFVKNLKFLEKFFLDVERRAEKEGHGNLNSKLSKFHKEVIKVNIWMIVLFIDFILLLLMPSNLAFWTHVLVMVIGAGLILSLYFVKYWGKS